MQLGAATLGDTSIGFSSTLVDLSLDGSTTSTAEFLGEKAVDLTLSPTSTGTYSGTASIGRQVAQSSSVSSASSATQTLGADVALSATGTTTATGTLIGGRNTGLSPTTTTTATANTTLGADVALSSTTSTTATGTLIGGRNTGLSTNASGAFSGTQTLGQSVATSPTSTGTLSFAPTTTGVDVSASLSSITFGDFGSTQGKLLVNMSTVDTTGITFNSTLGSNLAVDGATTSPTTFNSSLGAFFSVDSATNSTLTEAINKGRQVSIQPVYETVGETSLGETTLGLVDQNARVVSNVFSTVIKGRTVAFDSSVDSTLRINRRIDLTLSALAQSSSDWVVTKGVEVRFDSQTNTTLVLVPDFDEIIGKSRADGTQQQISQADGTQQQIVRSNGERIFILEAEGQID